MAAKSISVAADLDGVLDVLRGQARNQRAHIDETPLQNGVRVRLAGVAAAALNVYP